MVAAQDRLVTLPDGVPERTLGFEALAWAAKYLRHPDGPRAGQRWQFTHEQARFILWFYEVDEQGDWVWGHAARRLSKGPIAHSEMVPTPQGWKRHGDLKVWDEVYAVDGSVTRVLELGDEVNEDCYMLTWEDGSTVKCTGSHRWPLEDGRIMTVEEMNLAAGPLMSRSVPGISESRDLTSIEPITPEPARCITVAHPEHQYLVGEGWVPTCNSGKSPFAAVMAVIELLAPVRFDGFDSSVMGGCVGRPEAMPWVQIAAASADQTRNTMSVVRALLAKPNAPQLHEDYDLDLGKEKIYSGGVGVLEIITSSAASAEGSRATFIVADELEHWLPSNGGVELHGTLKANLTKTGNRMLETLNAWKPGLDSAGERTFNAWCEQEDGKARETKRKILYDSRMAPPDVNIGDEDSLREALEFVYADCPWSLRVLDAIIADFYTSSTSLDASKRKYLNWPTASVDAWCDPQKWAAMAKPDRVVEPGEDIGMFFDGSLSRDDTALIGVCLSDGHVFTIGIWSPGNSHDKAKQARINPESVDAKVRWAKATYNVRGFFADVREWEGYVKVHWPELFKDSLDIWARPRGDLPEPIAWDMRVFKRAFAQAAELTEAEIDQGTFTHDGDPMLSRHVRNAHRYDTQWGISVKKESPNSSLKIDGCVAMIGARHVYRLLKEAGTGKREMTYEAFFV